MEIRITKYGSFPIDWNEYKIKDIADIFGGGTPDTSKNEYWDGGIHWLSPTEISNLSEGEVYFENTVRKITDLGLKKSAAVLLPKGSIAFTSRATVGDCAIAKIEYSTNQGFINFICNKKVGNHFFYYWLKKNQNYIKRFCAGTTFLEISKREMGNLTIYLPQIEEQAQIANYLSTVDEAIRTTQNSIDKLEKLKKSLMQNMLTGKMKPDGTWRKEDEFWIDEKFGKVPKGWRIEKLRNIFKLSNGKFNPKSNLQNEKVEDFLYPVYGGNGIMGYYNEALITNVVIVIGRVGEYCGAVYLVEEPCWISDNALYISEIYSDDFDYDYWYYFLTEMKLNNYNDATGQPKITQSRIIGLRVVVPSFEEQVHIGRRIKEVERSIESKMIKIQKLGLLKESLMQNLLTGKIRLPEFAEKQTH